MADFPRTIEKSEDSRKNWREINKLTDLVKQLQTEMNRLSSGVTDLRLRPQLKEGGGSGSKIQRMYVLQEKPDYLICWIVGTTTEVRVAKPVQLRQTTWKDQTIQLWTYSEGSPGAAFQTSRWATYAGPVVADGLKATDKVREILEPIYNEPANPLFRYIYATEPEGGTGMLLEDGISPMTWIDMNLDARRFVAQRVLVEACVKVLGVDTVKRMVIEGGPAI